MNIIYISKELGKDFRYSENQDIILILRLNNEIKHYLQLLKYVLKYD
jgi:hypothetical protein